MNKIISYYDLLGMIKEGNIPKKVYWVDREKKKIAYKSTYDSVNNSFNCYILQHRNQETEDIKFYLSECLLESSFFNECIEIPNDAFEDIEKITSLITPIPQELKAELGGVVAIYNSSIYKLKDTINSLIKNQRKIIEMLKEN